MKNWQCSVTLLLVSALMSSVASAQQMSGWGYSQGATGTQSGFVGGQTGLAPGGHMNGMNSGYAMQGLGNGFGGVGSQTPNYTMPASGCNAPVTTHTVPAQATTPAPQSAVPSYGAPSAAGGVVSQTPEFQSGPPVTTQVITGQPVDGGTVVSAPFHAGSGDCWGSPVVAAAAPAGPACPCFFGGVYGLIMDRVDSDGICFAYDPAVHDRLYLSSRDASMNTAGGVEARIGKTFNCCRWGIEGVYWGIFPDTEFASANIAQVAAASMYTTGDYRDVYLDFSTGLRDNIDNYFNDGSIQTMEIRRSFEYHNFEINFLSGPLSPPSCGDPCGDPCGPSCGAGGCGAGGCGLGRCGLRRFQPNCGQQPRWLAGWLVGFRYFRMDEDFMLAVDNGDGFVDYTYQGGDSEFFHQIETENHLYGVQLGLNLNYFFTSCFQLDLGSKFGFYGNHMENYQRIFNTTGPAYVNMASPNNYSVRSERNDIAFLGEIRAGVGYKIGCHWRLTGGYRAVAASNVALPLAQLGYGREVRSPYKVGHIDNDSSLILHGAYFGVEFAW